MKKVLKIFGYLLIGLLVLVLGLAAYIQWAPKPTYHFPVPDVKITPDSARLAEGRRIVMTDCAHCHRGPDGKLSGDIWMNDPNYGKYWSANITRDPNSGIGQYTDGELVRLLRTGVKRNGQFAGPWMTFPLMSDEDLASVISFLRSDAPEVQASPVNTPPPQVSFMFHLFTKMILKPVKVEYKPIETPSSDDKIAYGRYLATGRWECYRCHSASFETNNDLEPEKSEGFFAGGNPVTDKENNHMLSANITPDPETGIGSWTEAQFAEAVRFGKRPDGRALSPIMPPMTVLTDAEISALWAYLRTVPPVKNPVDRTFNQ